MKTFGGQSAELQKQKLVRDQLKREIALKRNPPIERPLPAKLFGLDRWEGE